VANYDTPEMPSAEELYNARAANDDTAQMTDQAQMAVALAREMGIGELVERELVLLRASLHPAPEITQ
jgi:hypothetical protein